MLDLPHFPVASDRADASPLLRCASDPLSQLILYIRAMPAEISILDPVVAALTQGLPLTSRKTWPAHITASAIALREESVLVVRHETLGKWLPPGGHVEEGEEFEPAAYRELAEETGIHLSGGLRLWRDEDFRYSDMDRPFRYQVWVAPTTLTDADIIVGEGRQIVFVAPDLLQALEMSESCAYFTAELLASDTYQSLVAELAR